MKHIVSFFLLAGLWLITGAGCAPAVQIQPTVTVVPATATTSPTQLPPTPTLDAATFLGNFHWFGNAAATLIPWNSPDAITITRMFAKKAVGLLAS